jgi:hypothetical protein
LPQPYSSVVTYSKTATSDAQFRIMNTDLWLSNANIHCNTHDALYGNVTEQPATVSAGDILTFERFNLADLYFKNASAGDNTVIYVVGITMSKEEINKLLRG